MVRMKGFEPLTSYTRSKRSTKLSYILRSIFFLHILFYTFFHRIDSLFYSNCAFPVYN